MMNEEKNRGEIVITYLELAKLLGLEDHSIRKTFEIDQGEEILHILHEDSRYSNKYPDGAKTVVVGFDKFSATIDNEYINKYVLSRLNVEPAYVIELIFGVKLYPYQKDALNICQHNKSNRHYWDRQEGATTCAIYEAIYLACFCQRNIIFLTEPLSGWNLLLSKMCNLLQDRCIFYKLEDDRIAFNTGGKINFVPKTTLDCYLKGRRIDRIIADNLNSISNVKVKLKNYKTSFYKTIE